MFNAAKVAQPEPLLAPQAVFEQHLKQQRFTGPIRQVVYAPHINQPMPQPISQIHTQPMSQIHPQLSQQTNQQIRSPRNQTKYQKMVKQANDNQN